MAELSRPSVLNTAGDDSASTLARQLLARPAFAVSWGGRTRLVSAAVDWRARARSVQAVPAYRAQARAWRKIVAAWVACLPPGFGSAEVLPMDWLPADVAHLDPVDAVIGTPGPFQAVLVRLGNRRDDYRIEAIAKILVSTSDGARARVGTEASAMRESIIHGIVPDVVGMGLVASHPFFVMRYVRGRPLGSGWQDVRRAHEAIAYQEAPVCHVPAREHPWLMGIAERFPEVQLDRLPSEVGVVRTHGDFAPWNVLRLRDGRVVLIDWEASIREGLPHTDLAHFVLACERYLRRRTAQVAARNAIRATAGLLRQPNARVGVLVALAAVARLTQEGSIGSGTGQGDYWRNVVQAATAVSS